LARNRELSFVGTAANMPAPKLAPSEIEIISVPPKVGAKMLGVGKTTMAALIRSGAVKSIKIGKARRVEVASIRRLAAEGVPSTEAA
jgi:hypothetical protein